MNNEHAASSARPGSGQSDAAARAVAIGAVTAAATAAIIRYRIRKRRNTRRAEHQPAAHKLPHMNNRKKPGASSGGGCYDRHAVQPGALDDISFDEIIAHAPPSRQSSLKRRQTRERSASSASTTTLLSSGTFDNHEFKSQMQGLASKVLLAKRTVSGFSGLAFGDPGNTPTAAVALAVFHKLATREPSEDSDTDDATHDAAVKPLTPSSSSSKKLHDGQLTITHDAFCRALLDELRLNLSKEEAGRLFYNFDRVGAGRLTLRAFLVAVRDSVFLRRVVSSLQFPVRATVAPDYDYSKPTCQALRHPEYVVDDFKHGTSKTKQYAPSLHGPLVGEFVDVRRALDYSWHTNYTEERQKWQDALVKNVALRHHPVRWPWLVLTCGAMGAGKGYALRWLSRNGVFPLDSVVKIDPDHFKAAMPEWQGYIEHAPLLAGSLTHTESGLIQELAQEMSLQGRQNTWIDGSLQDHEWWSGWMRGVRLKYPWYRIAIFYVYAKPQQVVERARMRGEQTGRFVPPDVLLNSITRAAASVDILGPLADFVVRIDNSCTDSPHPALDVFEDRSRSFRAITDRFRTRVDPNHHFPDSLGTVRLVRTGGHIGRDTHIRAIAAVAGNTSPPLDSKGTHIDGPSWELPLDPWNMLVSSSDDLKRIRTTDIFPQCRFGGAESPLGILISTTVLLLSRCSPVTLDGHSRRIAGIPRTADLFCWCHGASLDGKNRLKRQQAIDRVAILKMQASLKTCAEEIVAADDGRELQSPRRPGARDGLMAQVIIDEHPFLPVLLHGGFLYFEKETRTLVAANWHAPAYMVFDDDVDDEASDSDDAADGQTTSARSMVGGSVCSPTSKQSSSRNSPERRPKISTSFSLRFLGAQRVPRTLDLGKRLVEVVDGSLCANGARSVAWLLPGTLIELRYFAL
eukprot:INCI10168.2.p1 GENE.INCI10168.2~~INCI10168.2.p1  ORF type:complete len:913 (+),score=130.86 INCI10168.2:143-2881(+)